MVQDGVRDHPELRVLTFVEILRDERFLEDVRTYPDLLSNGKRFGAALAFEGMKPSDAFAIIMRNHAEFVDAMIGSEIAQTIFVPIDPRTRGDKLRYMMEFAECRGALVADYALAQLMELLPQLPELEWIWVVGGDNLPNSATVRITALIDVLALEAVDVELPETDISAPMQMLYTSGTTGDPKAIVAPYARFASVASLGATIGLRHDDRMYTGLSLTHANAQLISLGNALSAGLPLIISRQFTKSRLWDILLHYDCSTFSLLGGMAIAIYAEPPAEHDRKHNVRYVLSAGMPEPLWEPFADRFGVDVFEFFGAAEGGLLLNPPGMGPRGSIGRPQPGVICKIFDAHGRECPLGTIGEICFRPETGEHPPVTYFKNPRASEEKVKDGWFRTGDAGYMDGAGWAYFSHRISSSIRRNGDFISASHIEAELSTLPDIADVHVYGIPTPANAPGEKEVVAAIVLHDRNIFEPRQIFDHCRSQIGSNSVPNIVQIVSEIPKTASEKPQERFLIEMLTTGRCTLFDPSGREIEFSSRRALS